MKEATGGVLASLNMSSDITTLRVVTGMVARHGDWRWRN